TVENSSPSRTTHSAAVAPPFMARRTTSVARKARSASSWGVLRSRVVVISIKLEVRSQIEEVNQVKITGRSLLQSDFLLLTFPSLHESAGFPLGGAADGQAVDLDGWDAYADGNGLSIFAAGADAFIEFQIIADHRNPGQDIGPVADKRCPLDGRSDLSVFDEIGFRR